MAYLIEAEQRRLAAANLDLALRALDSVYLEIAEDRLPRKELLDEGDPQLLRKALEFFEQIARTNGTRLDVRLRQGHAG